MNDKFIINNRKVEFNSNIMEQMCIEVKDVPIGETWPYIFKSA